MYAFLLLCDFIQIGENSAQIALDGTLEAGSQFMGGGRPLPTHPLLVGLISNAHHTLTNFPDGRMANSTSEQVHNTFHMFKPEKPKVDQHVFTSAYVCMVIINRVQHSPVGSID
jgi:hypothetical protein